MNAVTLLSFLVGPVCLRGWSFQPYPRRTIHHFDSPRKTRTSIMLIWTTNSKAEKDTPCTGHEPNVCIYASNRILYMPCPRRNHRIRRQSISAPSIPVRPKIKETKINNQRTIQSTYTCFQAVEDNTASPRRNRHDPNHHLRDHSDSLHQLLHLTLVFHMPEKPGSSVRVPA